MTVRDDFDRLLTVWLDETAGVGAPDYLDETLEGLAGIGQRPAWLSPGRWLPMQLAMPRVYIPRAVPILIAIGLLMAALIAAALIVGSQRRLPPPFGLATTGDLAFDRDGDIFLSTPDGTQTRPLISGPAEAFGASWSRDGRRIAYWSVAPGALAGNLRLVDADGRNERDAAPGRQFEANRTFAAVEWGPRSDVFAFTEGAEGGALYVGGDPPRDLKRYGDPTVKYSLPSWSPLGDRIAVVGMTEAGEQAVYVIGSDGTGLERVAGLPLEIGGLLTWSSDGRRVAYHATGDIIVAELGDSGDWTTRPLVGGIEKDWFPAWSNDGRRLAFLRSDGPTEEGHVFIADAGGQGAVAIDSPLLGWGPLCWSPDDRTIRAIVTDDPNTPLDQIPRPRYALLTVDDTAPSVEVEAPGMLTFGACSWQRLAP